VTWDCAVVGLGAMGSATLWQLAARGARAAGVDRFAPPHDRGSTHGESRIIRSAYFEDPAYVPLVRRAFTLWRELEAESGESLLTMTGALMIGSPGSPLVDGALHAARSHGLEHELLDAAEAHRRFPHHLLDEHDVALYERDGGMLAPERAVAAMLRRATALGAQVTTGVGAQRIEASRNGGVRVHLDDGTNLDARRAVVCAGAWLPALLPELPVPLWVERQVCAWFPISDGWPLAAGTFPVFIRQRNTTRGRLVYGVPAPDGASIKLAVHHEGARVDPDAVPREVTADDLRPLQEYVAAHMWGLEPHPVRAITCIYTNTPDEHFVVERMPGMGAVVVVSACSGHGFKFAPALGEAAASLALDGGAD
jgi:sarcosine oxidase